MVIASRRRAASFWDVSFVEDAGLWLWLLLLLLLWFIILSIILSLCLLCQSRLVLVDRGAVPIAPLASFAGKILVFLGCRMSPFGSLLLPLLLSKKWHVDAHQFAQPLIGATLAHRFGRCGEHFWQ